MRCFYVIAFVGLLLAQGVSAAEPMPPIHAAHPRLAFKPETAKEDAARLLRSPFWKDFATRARRHLENDAANTPRSLTDAICHGGLLALATNDAEMGAKA